MVCRENWGLHQLCGLRHQGIRKKHRRSLLLSRTAARIANEEGGLGELGRMYFLACLWAPRQPASIAHPISSQNIS